MEDKVGPVSYTHLDVYKRQDWIFTDQFILLGIFLRLTLDLIKPV